MKTVVLGVGNVLLRDEGVGVHAVKMLATCELPKDVEVIDGGTSGFDLIDVICEAERLIVIDAVRAGGEPGTIYHFELQDLEGSLSSFKASFHEIGIIDVIRAAELLGKKPRVEIFGVEPKSVEVGMELSEEIANKIPHLVNKVVSRIMECN
jgi:hydrogenase maturation protease